VTRRPASPKAQMRPNISPPNQSSSSLHSSAQTVAARLIVPAALFARFNGRRVSGRGWRRGRNLRAYAPIYGQPGQREPAENSRTKRHSEKNRTGPIELSNASGLSELFVEPMERWHLSRFQFAWRHQFRSLWRFEKPAARASCHDVFRCQGPCLGGGLPPHAGATPSAGRRSAGVRVVISDAN
jgi:hypothetical protein